MNGRRTGAQVRRSRSESLLVRLDPVRSTSKHGGADITSGVTLRRHACASAIGMFSFGPGGGHIWRARNSAPAWPGRFTYPVVSAIRGARAELCLRLCRERDRFAEN